MATESPSESRNVTHEDTEVTFEHRHPDQHLFLLDCHGQQQQLAEASGRELDLESSLLRQTSIYSRKLDEIQNTVAEHGKTSGSMNMDEFLTNIWNAEEGQVTSGAGGATTAEAPPSSEDHLTIDGGTDGLRQQSSLSVPVPLCRKTVEEVWAEINHGRHNHTDRVHQQSGVQEDDGGGDVNAGSVPRQPTFGEMTLEDFLIKAGVVREGQPCVGGPPPPPPVGHATAGLQIPVVMALMDRHHQGVEPLGLSNGLGGYAVRNGYGGSGRLANGYGVAAVVGSPASPGGSSEMGGSQVDNSAAAAAYGTDRMIVAAKGMGGRKRSSENEVPDKVMDRRQRRMIKNRESAARSRARKQAYTVELEAELNQLKEENSRLREEQKREMQMRKQQLLDSMAAQAQAQAQANAKNAVRLLRRCNSCPW